MKTKYVCRGLISLYVNLYYNRTMWSTNLHEKNCRWGEKEKEPKWYLEGERGAAELFKKLHKASSYELNKSLKSNSVQ